MDPQNVVLKQTINLPTTAFSMKANLPQAEPKMLARWEQEKLYHKIRASRAGRPTYVLHDGPPYANGRIHLGTAFNKILKDFVVKSKTMAGFDSPYVPGWDCHGLPIEIKVDSELGSKKAQMTAVQIRRACRKYAEKYVEIQRQDFKRLGVLGRWEDPYLTMSAKYQSVIAGAFVDFLDRGYVYKGLKPVHWCIKDRTALAEAEVEYADHTSPSIWVRFALTSDPAAIDPALAGRKVYAVIWTTTPWTIPANMAIAYNPRYEYAAVDVAGAVYLVAADLVKVTAEKLGWRDYQTIATFQGAQIEGAVFRHPLFERDSVGILADHVTLEQGTGAVHTAPGHGQEDYAIGQKYGIATFCPVDAAGRFFRAEGAPGTSAGRADRQDGVGRQPHRDGAFAGSGRAAGHGETGALLPALLALPQPGDLPRHRAVVHRHGDESFPPGRAGSHQAREVDAGVGAGAHLQHDRGAPRLVHLAAARVGRADHRVLLRGLPRAGDGPQDSGQRSSRSLPSTRRISGTNGRRRSYFRRGTRAPSAAARNSPRRPTFWTCGSIPDRATWRCSTTASACRGRRMCTWKAAISIAAGSTVRCWWARACAASAPYRECLLNGWVLDGEGKAMHKSLGNSIEPETVIKDHGADILRLWTASVEFNEDVRMSPTILTRLVDAYRKLRNTFRYMLGNLADFDAARDAVPAGEMAELDQWMLLRAEDLVARCRDWYDELRVPQGVSRGLRLLHGGSERGVLRCVEGPALHLGAEIEGAAQRANRAVPAAGRASCACWRR